MRRAPPLQFVPLSDDDLTPCEIRHEIARLTGLYAHMVGVGESVAILMKIASALQPGGRA